jgi:hypothetical protein
MHRRALSRITFHSAHLAVVLALAFALALRQPAYADDVRPPPVPANIQVAPGNVPFLVGHAVGTQNYVCVPAGSGVAFVLSTPQATLFSDDEEQLIMHFFSPNPDENNTDPAVSATGMIRATWQHSRDASTVWAQVTKDDGEPRCEWRYPCCSDASGAVATRLLGSGRRPHRRDAPDDQREINGQRSRVREF